MTEGPTEFDCTVTNWAYVYGLCREVSGGVRDAGYDPDVVVALARGGWFAGRCVCDFLGLDDLVSLKVEHYVGTADRTDGAEVRYPLPEGSVAGKDVLVVDDIVDTGGSLRRAVDHVRERDPGGVHTATLHAVPDAGAEPDVVGERLAAWTWVVYPWNFLEDALELVTGVMERADAAVLDETAIRARLASDHGVTRADLEVAQPDRLGEVMDELVRRGHAERVDGEGWRLLGDEAGG